MTSKRTLTEFSPTGLRVPKRRIPLPVRDRTSLRVIAALTKDFDAHGQGAIEDLRQKNPATYMRLIAALLPKEALPPRPLEGFTDEELASARTALEDMVRRARNGGSGGGDETGG
jgi:hypothetical protein